MYAKKFRREVNTQVNERKITMENKKTQDLMSRKSTLKSKLMAAVSMLLVSAIMVSVTTYAWFILSTAPEVKGMSTTVGSNGALEMALLNNDTGANLNLIKSSVGDSSAVKSVVESNVTWGNLVDLNDASYGLDGITMYPARLNWAADSTDTLFSRSKLLAYAQYGTDGRIADLIAADSGTNITGGFAANENSYGVRAIGTAKNQDPMAAALQSAQASFVNSVRSAKDQVLAALNGSTQAIGDIAYKHARPPAAGEYYTEEQVNGIRTALAGLTSSTVKMEDALKYALMAKAAAGDNGTELKYGDVTLSTSDATVGEYYGKLTAFRAALGEITVPDAPADTQKGYAWSEIENAYKALLDIDTMTLGDGENAKTTAEVRKMSDQEKQDWAIDLARLGLTITAKKGLFSDAVNFVDEVTSTVEVKVERIECKVHVVKTENVQEAYLVALGKVVAAYDYTGKGEAQPYLTDKYGYAVDLAFRSNAAGELRLSEAAKRVEGDNTDTTQGAGCFFTAGGDSDAKALAALRIAFVNDSNKVLAVGKLDTAAAEGGKYPVHLYSFTVADGVLTVSNNQIANDKILDMTANTAVALTAVVYMDGDATSFAQGALSGSLNLQFCTSANLQAMNYNNYATAGLSFTGNATTATVAGGEIDLPIVNMNGTKINNDKLTWKSSNTAVATIENGKIKPQAAGKTTISAEYTDGSGTHIGSYELEITD